jgi:ABC-2 type transport system permease protein
VTTPSTNASATRADAGQGAAPAVRLDRGGTARRLRAISRKEFVQLGRDRRTLLMMIGMPLVLLLIFGYGIRLSVHGINAELVGHDSAAVRSALESQDQFSVRTNVAPDEAAARADLLHGRTSVAVVMATTGRPTEILIDGSDAFVAQNSLEYLRALGAGPGSRAIHVVILFNPTLRSANFMVPAEVGMIMLWVGTVATAIGVVREREQGTLEQLMMTPIRKLELMVGKILPYSALTLFDAVLITVLGVTLFHVTVRGNPLELLLFAIPFLVASLSIGLLISTVAQNQRQAMQTAAFLLLPQILLSGALFPLAAMPWGIRWIAQLLPLTYFTPITRGVFSKGLGIGDLWPDVAVLCGMAVVFTTLAAVTFRSRLD